MSRNNEFKLKIRKLFTKWQIIFLTVMLLGSIILIQPSPFSQGVSITGVAINSPAALAGISIPDSKVSPVGRERITDINEFTVRSLSDYYSAIDKIKENDTVYIKTSKSIYTVIATNNDLGLRVSEVAKSNIRMGLDLQGGTRVLLEPANTITPDQFMTLKDNIEKRLNLYGLADIRVSIINDAPVGGKPQYLLVEMAGVSIDEVKNLISRQGKFEAKIANVTVFYGTDIRSISSDAKAGAGVDARTCGSVSGGGMSCQFRFPITLSLEAAQRQAQMTSNLSITTEGTQRYLSEKIELYLDDQLVDSLFIGADLRGRAVTDIQISGSGSGSSTDAAVNDAVKKMKELQTVLKTGGLPSKLNIIRADTISASLGSKFISNAFLMGFLILVAIGAVVYVRYRSFKIVLPMVFTSFCELVLIFGFAALAGWNIDLAAIAGIIIMMGTGIDHQIIIIDEIRAGESRAESWIARLKNAFSIIMIAYFTTVVAMLPLLFAGAGILKGFALTTIVGVTIGVFITRPAYGAISQVLHND